ncbi:MAG TPA: undecaprenyl-phosphate glucose phosphotransferase, partial [Beijerinckiaceae bacterium]|nr:undecaprenyl-phosphate glucose phosphotransferase [Beijerinckiaceae bacterium]
MSGFDIRTFLQAASAAATVEGGQARPARPSAAVPTAEGVAGVPIRQSYSPVVLAGFVRALE